MATISSIWGGAKQIAYAMGRTFMEYKWVGKSKGAMYRKFRDGTIVVKRSSHPSKRLYIIGIADSKAPLKYVNAFGTRSFSAKELLNLSSILNTIWARGKKPAMRKSLSHSTVGFTTWKKGKV